MTETIKKYSIDVSLIEKKRKKLKYSWSTVHKQMGISCWNLKRVRDLKHTNNPNEYVKIMNWISKRDVKRENELEQIRLEEIKKLKEEQLAKAREEEERLEQQREAVFQSRLQKELDHIEKESKKQIFRNIKYVVEINGNVTQKVYSKGTFIRIPSGVDLEEIGEFYYRFKRVLEVNNRNIHVDKETYIRSVDLSTLSMEVLQKYYNDGVIEVFTKA